ncbi:MAG: DnaJ domain-containing protein [Elusimicrobiota bacterium]
MNKSNYKQIDNARKTLGLGKKASISEIKNAYRKLLLKYHPDRREEQDKKEGEEKIKKINRAYEVLKEYCLEFKISFEEENIKEHDQKKAYKEHMSRFYDDWWFDLKDKQE